jgi:hypothetical protein
MALTLKMESRIIYYYQTFIGLSIDKIYKYVSHIHLSSIHFGNTNGIPYIHLNDNNPDDKIFDDVWNDMIKAHDKGIKIILMVGGAGGAYTELFNNYEIYFGLLVDTIKKHPCISGIDLDIEEEVDLLHVRRLINDIDDTFGSDFIITMAPLAYSLMNDIPGMGGFCYKDLYNTPEGQRINYFNGQFYNGTFGINTYNKIIDNGYPPSKIVIGMQSSDYSKSIFQNALYTIKTLKNQYPDFGGVYDWEYFNAPPDTDPTQWAKLMFEASNNININININKNFNNKKKCCIFNLIQNIKETIFDYIDLIKNEIKIPTTDWVKTHNE